MTIERSEIVETDSPWVKAARIEISAPASKIFDLLADAQRHSEIDGSSTVKAIVSGPSRLYLGAKFKMKMRLGINYQITNKVVEFEENRIIAWRHIGQWRWRYVLEELSPNLTRVTEYFDAEHAPLVAKRWISFRKALPWIQIALAKTLVRLKLHVEV